jgi:hypothetical protein
MSRSRKKPIYKDRSMTTHEYWSAIRHEWKQSLNQNYYKDDFYLRNSKSIRNDWDYSDYKFIIDIIDTEKEENYAHFFGWTEDDAKKWSRK